MRTALLAFASLLLLSGGASAQGNAPFCAQAMPGYGDAIYCHYFSLDQCRMDRIGLGGVCIPNPRGAMGNATGEVRHRRPRR